MPRPYPVIDPMKARAADRQPAFRAKVHFARKKHQTILSSRGLVWSPDDEKTEVSREEMVYRAIRRILPCRFHPLRVNDHKGNLTVWWPTREALDLGRYVSEASWEFDGGECGELTEHRIGPEGRFVVGYDMVGPLWNELDE